MRSVIVVDPIKSSLVMTSEIVKECVSGVSIKIATNGHDCLNLVDSNNFDMMIIDFDLPDTDGVSLYNLLRNTYKGPIIIMAYPSDDNVVQDAIDKELFLYADSAQWLHKPISKKLLSQIIQKYLMQ